MQKYYERRLKDTNPASYEINHINLIFTIYSIAIFVQNHDLFDFIFNYMKEHNIINMRNGNVELKYSHSDNKQLSIKNIFEFNVFDYIGDDYVDLRFELDITFVEKMYNVLYKYYDSDNSPSYYDESGLNLSLALVENPELLNNQIIMWKNSPIINIITYLIYYNNFELAEKLFIYVEFLFKKYKPASDFTSEKRKQIYNNLTLVSYNIK
jgi:hypothetical protein